MGIMMNQDTAEKGDAASALDRAATFLWTSGRVLEQRRFEVLFQKADGVGLAAALAAYRTGDGAFAYGLEPDIRGPEPQPLSVATALAVLADAGALPGPLVAPALDWTASISAPDGGVPAVLPTLARYPHPPFMPVVTDPPGTLLATGQILAPVLRAGIEHPWIDSAVRFTRREIEALGQTHPYDVEAAVSFLDATVDRAWAGAQAARLGALVREQRIVLLDPARPQDAVISPGYAPGEYHLPHDFAPRPDSLARTWFSDEEMARGLDHLAAAQEADGGWPVTWAKWSPTTELEARPGVTIRALRTLRAYARL
ncbi:MAG: hypothetical protein HOV87_06190 [Catenulispora sp.]|nr:hypothetical protein [Catenulispora sp.]